jgi:hypothetical protein
MGEALEQFCYKNIMANGDRAHTSVELLHRLKDNGRQLNWKLMHW